MSALLSKDLERINKKFYGDKINKINNIMERKIGWYKTQGDFIEKNKHY